jgi:hypothetical protein
MLHIRFIILIGTLLVQYGLSYAAVNDAKSVTSTLNATPRSGEGTEGAPKFIVKEVCDGPKCQSTLAYNAAITPANLLAFINQTANLPAGTIVLFHSQGGDLSTGIRLGQIIRQKNFNTRVGQIQEQQTTLIKVPGSCLSSCALAFLGGIKRQLDPQDELGFYPLKSSKDSSSKISEDDLVKALANIDRYFIQMSINSKLLEQIMRTESNRILMVNPTTARALNIENTSKGEPNPWMVQSLDNGIVVAITSEKQDGGKFNITLGLSKNRGNFRLTILIKPIANFNDIAKLTEQLNAEQLLLVFGTEAIKPKLEKPWQATSIGSQSIYSLKENDLKDLARQVDFRLFIPMAVLNQFDFDQNTHFSGRGLSGAMTALK